MTSSSADRRLALVALVGLLAAGSSAAVTATSATFSAEATGTATLGVARQCTGDVATYTSGLLDEAGPVLRWSFSTPPVIAAAPPVEVAPPTAVAHPAGPVTPDAGPAPTGEPAPAAGSGATDGIPPASEHPGAGDPVGAGTVDGGSVGSGSPGGGPLPEDAGDPSSSPDTAGDPAGDPTADPAAGSAPGPTIPEPTAEPAPTPAPTPEPAPEPAPVSPPAPAPPVAATGGLLACDPVDLAAGGAADPAVTRALDLPGGPGSGLSSDTPVATAGPVTLLLWVRVPAGAPDGDLASLRVPGGDAPAVVLAVTGDRLAAGARQVGTTTHLAATGLPRDATHLVAVAVDGGPDGVRTVSLAVDDAPATPPAPLPATLPLPDAVLTLGAHGDASSTAARVDEVTVVPGALGPADRAALLAADRWWAAR